MKRLAISIFITIAMVAGALAGERKPISPSPRNRCPVCEMFVAKCPDFFAEVIFKNGSYRVFGGANDLFKYYLNLKKYAPAKRVEDIASIYVTDYYSLELIDGPQAWYVVGSDVFGPMGKELIPFSKESDARGFLKDHKGKSLLRFKDVSVELIRGLD